MAEQSKLLILIRLRGRVCNIKSTMKKNLYNFVSAIQSVQFRILFVAVISIGMAGFQLTTLAQESIQSQSGDDSAEVKELKANYKASVAELCELIKELKLLESQYIFATSDTNYEFKEAWEETAEKSEKVYARVRDNAIKLFLAMEKPTPDLMVVVRNFNSRLAQDGKIEVSYKLTKKLAKLFPDDLTLKRTMARVGIFNNDFDVAAEYFKENRSTVAAFSVKEQAVFLDVDVLKENFKREMELREKDKTANLPRVEMEIKGKGKVVIELFEDEAPETVGNFINLVESEFYTGHIFHRKIQSFLAHTGFMSMNRFEPVGYTIYDEAQKPNRRHHFRGSVCMWPGSTESNSGSAEFYILQIPGPYLTETNHTVFGRVISGMEVVDEIQNTRTINEEDGKETPIEDIMPDEIVSIKVLNKREGVDYQPNRVK